MAGTGSGDVDLDVKSKLLVFAGHVIILVCYPTIVHARTLPVRRFFFMFHVHFDRPSLSRCSLNPSIRCGLSLCLVLSMQTDLIMPAAFTVPIVFCPTIGPNYFLFSVVSDRCQLRWCGERLCFFFCSVFCFLFPIDSFLVFSPFFFLFFSFTCLFFSVR